MSSELGRREAGESFGRKSIIAAAQISPAPRSQFIALRFFLHHPKSALAVRCGEVTECDTFPATPIRFSGTAPCPAGARTLNRAEKKKDRKGISADRFRKDLRGKWG